MGGPNGKILGSRSWRTQGLCVMNESQIIIFPSGPPTQSISIFSYEHWVSFLKNSKKLLWLICDAIDWRVLENHKKNLQWKQFVNCFELEHEARNSSKNVTYFIFFFYCSHSFLATTANMFPLFFSATKTYKCTRQPFYGPAHVNPSRLTYVGFQYVMFMGLHEWGRTGHRK